MAALAPSTVHALGSRRRVSVERHLNAVCSLDEPGCVELVLENLGRVPRFCTVRDDVPDEFMAEPASFEVEAPGHRKVDARITVRSPDAGNLSLRAASMP